MVSVYNNEAARVDDKPERGFDGNCLPLVVSKGMRHEERFAKPIVLRRMGRRWQVWLDPVTAQRFGTKPQSVRGLGNDPVPIVRLPDGRLGLGLASQDPALLSKEDAKSVAHHLGRYVLDLGDFVWTYVEMPVAKRKKNAAPGRKINVVGVKVSRRDARERRSIAEQERAAAAANEYAAWRRNTLDQIETWAYANSQGWDDRYRAFMIKRLDKLVLFLRSFFDHEPQDVIGYEDAAALIVMPKASALRLARRLFRTGKGIAKDLATEDLWFNMDWFLPVGEGYH